MRKLIIILSSLTLVIILLMSASMPAIAAKPNGPNDNKPVAWVNAAVNSRKVEEYLPYPGTGIYPVDVAIIATIKLLSDGTYEGKVVTHPFDNKLMSFTVSINQTHTFIGEVGGVKYAQIETLQRQEPTGIEFRARFYFVDNDEPGKNDEYLMMVAWADFYDFLPDPSWGALFGSMFLTDGGLPNGNVQIHVKD